MIDQLKMEWTSRNHVATPIKKWRLIKLFVFFSIVNSSILITKQTAHSLSLSLFHSHTVVITVSRSVSILLCFELVLLCYWNFLRGNLRISFRKFHSFFYKILFITNFEWNIQILTQLASEVWPHSSHTHFDSFDKTK